MSARLASLFAGIGGFELAGKQVGIDTAWTSEIDAACNRVLDVHFPDVAHLGDITGIDARLLPSVDVLTAGSPCQDFSIAGMRRGLAGERSGLFAHFVRLIDELQPRFAVWENVPGALTSNGGQDFANVIGALVGSPEPLPLPKHPSGRRSRYAGIAHGPRGTLAWRVLDAQHFGVPQRRQRIFAVLDTQGWDSINVLFPGDDDGAGWGKRPIVSRGAAWAAALDTDDLPFDTSMVPPQPVKVRLAEILEPAVDERYFLSEKACLGILRRAAGRGRALPPILDYALRCQAGEPVGDPPPYSVQSVTGEIAHALKAEGHDGSEDGTGRGQPIVPVEVPELAACVTVGTGRRYDPETETLIPVSVSQNQRGEVRTSEVSAAISSGGGKPGQGYPAVLEPVPINGAYAIHGTQDPAPPLYRVRRLTPTECERLQGFPDGWTAVEGAKDSARYRQLGNAVAVPVATWVLGRVVEVLP